MGLFSSSFFDFLDLLFNLANEYIPLVLLNTFTACYAANKPLSPIIIFGNVPENKIFTYVFLKQSKNAIFFS